MLIENLRQALDLFLVRFLGLLTSWLAKPTVLLGEREKSEIRQQGVALVYVLARRSWIDLSVLLRFCRREGLPVPVLGQRTVLDKSSVIVIAMQRVGLFTPGRPQVSTPLQELVVGLNAESELKVLAIPVSMIWGRNATKKERSLFKILFPDDESAGLLQRIFIVAAQGRDSILHFGRAIDLSQQVRESSDRLATAKKLRRVFFVHFKNQRIVSQGHLSLNVHAF